MDLNDIEVMVGGSSIRIGVLVAFAEAIETERPQLFGFIRSTCSDPSMTQFDIRSIVRSLIRSDYDNYTGALLAKDGNSKISSDDLNFSLPPENIRTSSMENAYRIGAMLDEAEAERRSKFMCAICIEEHPINGSFILECNHRFCSESLSGYIRNKINDREVSEDKLVCPIPGCQAPIPHTTVAGCTTDLGDRALFEKFERFAIDSFIDKAIVDGNFMRCPNSRCEVAFEWRPSGSSLPYTCPGCTNGYCLNCAVLEGGIGPIHEPYTCEQQIQRNKESLKEKEKFDDWKRLNENATQLFEDMIRQNNWKSKSYVDLYSVNVGSSYLHINKHPKTSKI